MIPDDTLARPLTADEATQLAVHLAEHGQRGLAASILTRVAYDHLAGLVARIVAVPA